MRYIIVTKKIWNKDNFINLNKKFKILKKIQKLKLKKLNPKIIFFIHWSKLIPKEIYNNYCCIQFHASNLPNGRGGSPIQNQILRNIEKTKITAFKVSKNLDAGPICMKRKFELNGNAKTIYKNMETICLDMIKKIIKIKNIKFKKQIGKVTFFKRRKPSESKINLSKTYSIDKIYDFLRMLDAPGYPNAFIELKDLKFTFNDIKKKKDEVIAKAIITRK